MTTTITLKTHTWPVKVTTTDHYSTDVLEHHGVTTEVVPINSTRDFHITSTRSIAFDELPVPVESPAA